MIIGLIQAINSCRGDVSGAWGSKTSPFFFSSGAGFQKNILIINLKFSQHPLFGGKRDLLHLTRVITAQASSETVAVLIGEKADSFLVPQSLFTTVVTAIPAKNTTSITNKRAIFFIISSNFLGILKYRVISISVILNNRFTPLYLIIFNLSS
jgi:hypothetical protein